MPAQVPNGQPASVSRSKAPLFLSINGPGRVVPFHNGEMLPAGHDCVMTAIPDRGRMFVNWSQVSVFTFVDYVSDEDGNVSTVTNIVTSPGGKVIKSRVLRFQAQPAEVIFDAPGASIVTESYGWQANFVPRR
jgi:hypothetical protein